MAEPMTTMFGKAYDTVGSADRNLVLQTRGDLKVKWGNKYIDLIKNGKINVDVDLLKKVSSQEDIVKDGIYLIEDEKTKEVWVSVGGTKINVLGEVTNNYVAFVKEQDVDAENKLRALSNIGFFYKTLDDAKKAQLTQGIFFLLDQNKLYFVENGEYKEYVYTPTLEIPNPLVVGSITLNGTTSEISTLQELGIVVENDRYISITNNKILVDKEIVTSNAISSDNYVSNSKGFSIYYDNNNYIGEFDVIKVRKTILYDEIQDITYEELQKLISENSLYPNKKYRITDFFNEWDYYQYTINGTDSKQYYFPIVVTAKNSNELKPKGYLCDREDWVIEYDVSFNYLIDEILDQNNYVEIYTRGRITRLTDEFGNSANYDFKHRLFKYGASDDRKNWYYTYNVTRTVNPTSSKDVNNWEYIHSNWDASQDGNIVNNNINLPEPTIEDYTLHSGKVVQKVVQDDNYILFPDCSTIYPHDNEILSSQCKYVITGDFYNNKFKSLYDSSEQEVQFTSDFHNNIFQEVHDCVLNIPMQHNTFDYDITQLNIQNATITKCSFKGLINNASISGDLTKCQFEGLSGGIVITGPLNDMTIQSDITPSSANYVQDSVVITDYVSIGILMIDQQTVPRLAATIHKECFIDTRDGKQVFIVQLATDDNTPKGIILMWSGDINNVPPGYGVCDGRTINGIQMPNLSGRFIKMIDSNGFVGPVDNQDLESDGKSIKIKANNLPNHTHNIQVTVEQYTGSDSYSYVSSTSGTSVDEGEGNSVTTGDIVSTSSSSINLTHTHNATATNENRDNYANDPINIEPNYYALIFIMKL